MHSRNGSKNANQLKDERVLRSISKNNYGDKKSTTPSVTKGLNEF